MNEMEMNEREKLAGELFDCEAVKFGLFTFKSGIKSPNYVDMRVLVSYPETLKKIAGEMKRIAEGKKFDCITGIAYTGIPLATALSLQTGWRMIHNRKEVKEYGTKKALEGAFKEGETSLVIDDVITDGASKFEVIEPLEKAGLKVKDVVIVVDREQGGKARLAERGYELHSVFKLTELFTMLKDTGKINEETYKSNMDYLAMGAEKWEKEVLPGLGLQ